MTIQEAHIIFDSLLREINKEIEMNIIPEQKDIYINAAAVLKLKEAARQERDRVRTVVTYADIGDYYAQLGPFIVDLNLPVAVGDGRYNYATLPSPSTSLAKRGLYKNNTIYIVGRESENFDFSNITNDLSDGKAYIGQTFEVKIDNVGTSVGGNAQGELIVGNMYEIISASGLDLTTFGAPSNLKGTIFTCTKAYNFSGSNTTGVELKVYAAKPINAGVPIMVCTAVTSEDYAEVLLISALVDVAPPFKQGNLVKGSMYRVHDKGTTDLSTFGLSNYQENDTFISTKSGEPNWGSTPTALALVAYKGGELIKPVDLESKLNHAFGTTVSRPLCVIINNDVRIYHMGNFNVHRASIIYVRVPNKVNYKVGGELEFNEVEQFDLVHRAVNLAAASIPSPNYTTLKNEEVGSQQQQQVK